MSDHHSRSDTDCVEPYETRDGSYTLIDRRRDLHYSSTHGAADEARHVFVEGTNILEQSSPVRVLEFGFGGGINFIQTLRQLIGASQSGELVYHAVEHRPVSADTVDFHDEPGGSFIRRTLRQLHESDGTAASTTETFDDHRIQLHLHAIAWRELELDDFRADAVFFDPFGPNSQPEAWDTDSFDVARRHIQPEGRLTTYSAATDVKSAMFRAGFHVGSAPGAGPKREMTVASPSKDPLQSDDAVTLLNRRDYID